MVIQEEDFNMKESQQYNVLILMNPHQDEEGWYLVMLNKMQKQGGNTIYTGKRE